MRDGSQVETAESIMTTNSGQFDVVWPRSRRMVGLRPLARRLETLKGKKIAELWDFLFRGDEVFTALEEVLGARFAGIELVSWRQFGNIHGHDEAKVVAALPARLKQVGIDAVICGMAC
jgi:hypothetical protein